MASFPTPLELISSSDPAHWTKLVDLTVQLPASVHAFNASVPALSRITLLGKCEFANPGMSHKDRIAKTMLERAEARGDLLGLDGTTKKSILAASSGNTGCSLALVGSAMGYEVIVITDSKCSEEKRAHIRSNGATLWLAEELPSQFPEELGKETDYMAQEDLLAAAFPDRYYSVNQYGNGDNTDAHYGGTGAEIWEQTNGSVTHFVMSGSTGGTLQGCGRYLKERQADVEVVMADPEKSRLHGLLEARDDPAAGAAAVRAADAASAATGGVLVEGAGKGSLTDLMVAGGGTTLEFVDRAVVVGDFEAFDECRRTAEVSKLLVGGSSGLNICAAKVVAEFCAKEAPREKGVTIVTLLCDHGIKYLSKIFNDDWIKANDTRA
eukprot:CAMPEP_0194319982 /NCGR_PEP_ID=MMETSP0171-20130528/16377_1 /TAXON_ID=218684 /ORGANISM="Corethron pennatum, Strain L29A3" /LENGTH=380 /DNA_ID=CAMNT_0039077383 /DNA_START=240 /DNA_END=1382 /DNA_ORIENTATION=-